MSEGGLRLLDEPGEPLGAYLRHVLERDGLLGDGSGGLVLPRLTGQTICQVYAGVCLQERPRLVLDALLAGRRVWCPWEGLELTGQGALRRQIHERLWVLRRAGLTLCPLGQLAQGVREVAERRRGYGAGPGAGIGLVYPKGR